MKRYQEVDALKAFSIIGVIWIHSSALIQNSYIKIPSSYFRFCVPVFILISFYLLEKKNLQKGNQITYTNSLREGKDRVKRLLVPFIFWSFLYILVFQLNNFSWINIFRYFGGEAWAGQYYFLIILQLTIAYYLILNKINITQKVVTLSATFNLLLYSIRSAKYIFFSIGSNHSFV